MLHVGRQGCSLGIFVNSGGSRLVLRNPQGAVRFSRTVSASAPNLGFAGIHPGTVPVHKGFSPVSGDEKPLRAPGLAAIGFLKIIPQGDSGFAENFAGLQIDFYWNDAFSVDL